MLILFLYGTRRYFLIRNSKTFPSVNIFKIGRLFKSLTQYDIYENMDQRKI